MNKRIKELAQQALNIVSPNRDLTVALSEFELLFAALIIKESAEWVNDNVGLMDEAAQADLLKHFGIE